MRVAVEITHDKSGHVGICSDKVTKAVEESGGGLFAVLILPDETVNRNDPNLKSRREKYDAR